MKLVFNLFLILVILFVLNYIGWLHLFPSVRPPLGLNPLGVTAMIVALSLFVIQRAAYYVIVWLLAGLGLTRDAYLMRGRPILMGTGLLYPVLVGSINVGALYLTATILQGLLSLTKNFWLNLLVGIILAIGQVLSYGWGG